ncbi:hypothetical protein [Acinetobacter indicus]|uniref:hypothetical protein n=1 Tax=Acinetobacter indicus TaxID=756892 RepID=UPI001444844B|nr:hypothetical protein [Acinetobacter indicus]
MKKLLLLSLLSAIGASVSAASDCSIYYATDSKLTAIIQENSFKFDNYDAVCQRLKNANAKVNLRYSSAINVRQTTAVVVATVDDINLPIISNLYRTSMRSSPERTTVMEKVALMDAVNDVLNGINQSDIDDLNTNRKKLGFKTYPASASINK